MTWTVIWMALILKIPIVALLWICWWAIKAEPEPAADGPTDGGGGDAHSPSPRRPRPPRRGAHATPAPQPPSRVRALAKRSDSVPTQ